MNLEITNPSPCHWASMASSCTTFSQFWTVWKLSNDLEVKRAAWMYINQNHKDRLKEWAIKAKNMDEETF
jgi:hypothetical protein